MKTLFLSHTYDTTNGWGRYAEGFVRAARSAGAEVSAPALEGRPSVTTGRLQIAAAPLEALRLLEQARAADIIHALTEPSAPLAMCLSFLSGRPYAVSAIGTYSVLESYPPSVRWLYRAAFSRARGAAFLSRYTASVARKNFPNARSRVVHGGFDAPDSAPVREGPRPPYRILSVGALKPRKGFHSLIEAAALLKEKGFGFRLRVAGAGLEEGYGKKLLEMVKSNGLEGTVEFLGRVGEEDLGGLYASSDVFVLPSEHDGTAFEGLGLVYLEAMARGLPCVGCLESGAMDIIRDRENGRLVPPGAPLVLAAVIEDLLVRKEAWTAMSAAALKTASAFSWDAAAEAMRGLHEEVIAAHRHHSRV